ncbi:MAG: hypothetical protein AAFY15_05555, partial [Cyanobacteria bacterium J06648_11]
MNGRTSATLAKSGALVVFGGAAWTPETRRANENCRGWFAQRSPEVSPVYWFPEEIVPFCPVLAKQWMHQQGLWRSRPLSLLGFSAGCIAMRAIAGELGPDYVQAIAAVDGWCVPFHGIESPVYRL